MEDLISLLVIISVIISGLTKLIEKLTGQAVKQPTWQPGRLDNEEDLEVPVQAKEVVIKEVELSGSEAVITQEGDVRDKKKEIPIKRETKKIVSRAEKKKQAALFSNGITEEDLVKGVILAEILGEPRCRR